jgi:hypothetical protein
VSEGLDEDQKQLLETIDYAIGVLSDTSGGAIGSEQYEKEIAEGIAYYEGLKQKIVAKSSLEFEEYLLLANMAVEEELDSRHKA